ncbi:MAG: BrxA/BrxB family bacilliredoxin [Acidobacteriales bacterium]|nr:BrxA/BrxB family bacilliredoxin [Terriglobales bacterium]
MYPEPMIAPMRQELSRFGVAETRTAADVERAVKETPGTVMVIVNSVCGCAAGKMRPAVGMAMKHNVVPDKSITVFAGQDRDATEKARAYFVGYAPSSPSIGLLRDGKLVYMMERHQIETRDAASIAAELTSAFDKFCARSAVGGQ